MCEVVVEVPDDRVDVVAAVDRVDHLDQQRTGLHPEVVRRSPLAPPAQAKWIRVGPSASSWARYSAAAFSGKPREVGVDEPVEDGDLLLVEAIARDSRRLGANQGESFPVIRLIWYCGMPRS